MDIVKIGLEVLKKYGATTLLTIVVAYLIIDLIRTAKKTVNEYYENVIKENKVKLAELTTMCVNIQIKIERIHEYVLSDCAGYFKFSTKEFGSINDILVWLKEKHSPTDDNGTPIWYTPRSYIKLIEEVRDSLVDIKLGIKINKYQLTDDVNEKIDSIIDLSEQVLKLLNN